MGLAPLSRMVRTLVVAGAAALILSACAANRAGQAVNADYSNLSGPQIQARLTSLREIGPSAISQICPITGSTV